MPTKETPDWFDIKEGMRIITFKDNSVQKIKFLDNGLRGTTEIYDKRTKQVKEIDCVNFKVLDLSDNTEKSFNPIAKTLIESLKAFYPLINKSFKIELKEGIREVDNEYFIKQLSD